MASRCPLRDGRRKRRASTVRIAAATLAGIGAAALLGSLLTALGFELWFDRALDFPPGPVRFEPLGLPSYMVGSMVAMRLGGWRGVAGLTAFAALSFLYPLIIGTIRALPWPELDFFARAAWAAGGVVLGTVLTFHSRGAVPWFHALLAAGLYAVAISIWHVGFDAIYTSSTGGARPDWMNGVDAAGAAWAAAAGLFSGAAVGSRIGRVELVVLVGCIASTSAVIVAHQGAMAWSDGPTFFLSMATSLIGACGIAVGAIWARLRDASVVLASAPR
jgi:hypothetical protein